MWRHFNVESLTYSQYFIHISKQFGQYHQFTRFKCSLKIFSKWNHFVGVLSVFNACVDVVHGVREVVSWSSCLLPSLASLSLQYDHNSASTMPAQVLTAPSKWPVRTKNTELKLQIWNKSFSDVTPRRERFPRATILFSALSWAFSLLD